MRGRADPLKSHHCHHSPQVTLSPELYGSVASLPPHIPHPLFSAAKTKNPKSKIQVCKITQTSRNRLSFIFWPCDTSPVGASRLSGFMSVARRKTGMPESCICSRHLARYYMLSALLITICHSVWPMKKPGAVIIAAPMVRNKGSLNPSLSAHISRSCDLTCNSSYGIVATFFQMA